MKSARVFLLTVLFMCLFFSRAPGAGPSGPGEVARPDRLLAEYFKAETAKLEANCLTGVQTREDWEARRGEFRRQLLEMLGLWPMPERTDLKPTVTGRIEREDFIVEKLHFQAMPKLYVTANLYLPKTIEQPLPAILYVCGHGRVFTNGVSCGNKTAYQHHGIWFARNGYVCLMIDTVQLGEIEGLHHGTYRQGQWWWNSRGYTPAGVEAWFGVRALDYLCSRHEVDKERIGMTGRSGGGSYTWTVAALDDRVKVAAPVAGVTDLRNQVVDGVVEGHCDCMFYLNTYRWDFPQFAALLAPRPLLIGNTDKDTIFPLDGVVRLYNKVRGIYQLYGKTNQLGLLITEGPHKDTQDLQVPVFRWFNRFLKQQEGPVEMVARPMFPPQELRVFTELPADALNTNIQASFVPLPSPHPKLTAAELQQALRAKVFRGWPDDAAQPAATKGAHAKEKGLSYEAYEFNEPGLEGLRLYVLHDSKVRKPKTLALHILDEETWKTSPAAPLWIGWDPARLEAVRTQMREEQGVYAYFAPRGVEPGKWNQDPKKWTQVRRRYMLLGQTLDGMRVWDIVRAVQALEGVHGLRDIPITVRAQGQMGVNAAYAALFQPEMARLEVANLPLTQAQGPDYLQVLKVTDLPEVLGHLQPRLVSK